MLHVAVFCCVVGSEPSSHAVLDRLDPYRVVAALFNMHPLSRRDTNHVFHQENHVFQKEARYNRL